MTDDRTSIYLMPGMAANPAIFEGLKLDENTFRLHYLEWFQPEKEMTFEAYARQMCKQIKDENPVLIGVSFGGLLVQEMAMHINVQKVIIVSSVKSEKELPKRMIFAKYTKVHKLLPTGLVNNVELLAKYAFGETVTKRLALYEKYLSIRDKYYIDWSIDNIVNWKSKKRLQNLVHIQGEKDAVFPIGNITDCIQVKNGTHTMIIHRAKWFNENLPILIME